MTQMFTTDDESSRFGCRMRGRVVRKCLVKMSDRGNTSDDSRDQLDGISNTFLRYETISTFRLFCGTGETDGHTWVLGCQIHDNLVAAAISGAAMRRRRSFPSTRTCSRAPSTSGRTGKSACRPTSGRTRCGTSPSSQRTPDCGNDGGGAIQHNNVRMMMFDRFIPVSHIPFSSSNIHVVVQGVGVASPSAKHLVWWRKDIFLSVVAFLHFSYFSSRI